MTDRKTLLYCLCLIAVIFLAACDLFLLSEDEFYNRDVSGQSGEPDENIETCDFSIKISYDSSTYHYIDTIAVKVVFSERVQDLEISDISIKNGEIKDIRTYDNPEFLIRVRPNGQDLELSIPRGVIRNRAGKYNENPSNTLLLRADIFDNGTLTELSMSNSDDCIFGIDYDKHMLYEIDPFRETIQSRIQLPSTNPVAMDFSAADNKLYIIYKFKGAVDIYDIEDSTFSTYQFSFTQGGRDIEVDSVNRRIYIMTDQSRLFSLQMDTGAVIIDSADIDGRSMAIDENNRKIFTAGMGSSPSSLYRYSLDGDTLVREDYLWDAGSNGRRIVVSPDHSTICFPCGGGNGGGYTVYGYNAGDYRGVFGEWDIGTYPNMVFFHPGGEILYGTNGDPYDDNLYIMDVADYSLIRKLDFPNSDKGSIFSTNMSGSKAVGFSCDSHTGSGGKLYFFHDILK